MKTPSRTAEREKSARFLNTLDAETLWKLFGISRISYINGFDSIGIPVYSSTRPCSSSISINSGKGVTSMMARAGTIAESIEFAIAEVPQVMFPLKTIDEMRVFTRDFTVLLPDRWHLARGATLQHGMRFNWDAVASLDNPGTPAFLLPADLLYIAEVRSSHLIYFQASTNGWASGATPSDCILSGLYEVVERDAWTLWRWNIELREIWPPRVNLEEGLPLKWFHSITEKLSRARLKAYLFDISTNTGLPVFWATLYDQNPSPGGVFSGFGCAGSAQKAMERALLESIQSRACYIAGARDDLLRRSFLMMKAFDQTEAMRQMDTIHFTPPYTDPQPDANMSAAAELSVTRAVLSEHGFDDIFFKNAGQPIKGQSFTVGKVYAPCFEPYYCTHWVGGKRFRDYVSTC